MLREGVLGENFGEGAGEAQLHKWRDAGDGKKSGGVSVQKSTFVVETQKNKRECDRRHWSMNFRRTPRLSLGCK
jgi:hypothetical protein